MYFIISLPKSKKQNYSMCAKPAHFIPVKLTYKEVHIVDIFLKEIFRLHGILKEIILDRDTKFTINVWRSLFSRLETHLNFSTAYHLQTDRQTERLNQILEEILRMYVMKNPTKWEDYLHLVDFAYKNGHETSTNISPFEVLYG